MGLLEEGVEWMSKHPQYLVKHLSSHPPYILLIDNLDLLFPLSEYPE